MEKQQLIDEGYMEGKKSFEYQINKILQEFDFEKVYKVMKALDWHWKPDNEPYIPGVPTLKNRAIDLLKDVYENEKRLIATGGFMAGYDDGELWLNFTIEEAHTANF